MLNQSRVLLSVVNNGMAGAALLLAKSIAGRWLALHDDSDITHVLKCPNFHKACCIMEDTGAQLEDLCLFVPFGDMRAILRGAQDCGKFLGIDAGADRISDLYLDRSGRPNIIISSRYDVARLVVCLGVRCDLLAVIKSLNRERVVYEPLMLVQGFGLGEIPAIRVLHNSVRSCGANIMFLRR